MEYEKGLFELGYRTVAGMDEAGRGAWAGPLAVGMVVLPLDRADLMDHLKGVKDSKEMTPRQRVRAADKIKAVALTWGIGYIQPHEITDDAGLTVATYKAMSRAWDDAIGRYGEKYQVDLDVDAMLLDYFRWQNERIEHIFQMNIVKGDAYSLTIAAASVIAKTERDALMLALATDYHTDYGFAKNKGYHSATHFRALQTHGITPIHRRTYRPIVELLKGGESHVG